MCNQVMKFILDKIDKDEKQAAKKRKREESVEQKRSKQNASKLSALLFKHKEQLKAEILKKRALLDKELQVEVQVSTAESCKYVFCLAHTAVFCKFQPVLRPLETPYMSNSTFFTCVFLSLVSLVVVSL